MIRIVIGFILGALTLALATAAPAHADEMEDFADAVKDATGSYHRAWVLTKFTTFKLGKKCWAKLPDKKFGAIHTATFATRDLADYAKARTGDDWSAIETQNNNDRETNKKLVEPMMDAFKSQVSFTVSVDGDDCDAKQNSLWLRYWSGLVSAVRKYPPPAGKAFITLEVSSKIRDVTVDVSKDGTRFTVRAPKDIEATYWSDALERPFRKLVSGFTDDFAFAVMEATGSYHRAWTLTKFTTFKLGNKCRAKLADKKLGAIHMATFATRDLADYAKARTGDDWSAIETQSTNDRETNRKLVEQMMDAFKPRLAVTITVEGDDCDAKQNALWLRYWSSIARALAAYPPAAKTVKITLDVKAKAKDVTVKVGKGGASFAFTAPRDVEAKAWSDKLEAPFKKAAKHK